jgi:transcriptional regulator of met regulon
MNRSDFASVVGVSRSAITKAVSAGKLDMSGELILIDGPLTKAYLKSKGLNLDAKPLNVDGGKKSSLSSISDIELSRAVKVERIKTERLRQRKLEMELDRSEGNLICTAYVGTHVFSYLDALSDELLDSADTLIDTLHQNWEGIGEDARAINMTEINDYCSAAITEAKNKVKAALDGEK